jgi:peptide-methionine (R)-S-oxide reductase
MECIEHTLTIDEGQHVCNQCGTIFDTVIDEGAEWRQYEDHKGDDQRRAGVATSDLLPESSCGSVISHKGIAPTNTTLKAIQRLSCWSVFSNSERSWMNIFDTIQAACNQIHLPKAIAMDACGLYKQMGDAQKVRGETRRACMGAALFVACRNNAALRARLDQLSFEVLRRAATEAPNVGEYTDTETVGVYKCKACGNELFRSENKFHSGCGWPSFYAPTSADAVELIEDRSLAPRIRTEVRCAKCGSHMGHVFEGEGYDVPTDQRWCINSVSLVLEPK